jgi:hypothetical protein
LDIRGVLSEIRLFLARGRWRGAGGARGLHGCLRG